MAGVRKFDHDEARRRYAAGESGTALAREYGVTPKAVYRLVNQRTAAREKVRQREYQTAICEECRGPCSYNPYSRARRDRLLCRSCAGKADRTNVSLTDGGQLVEVRCCTCRRWLDPDDFSRGIRYRDLRDGGFHKSCRRCLTVLRQDYRERRAPRQQRHRPLPRLLPRNPESGRMTSTLSLFRIYETVGDDGYPPEWHDTIKHTVRENAGHRCIRCGHPYAKGDGEWSPCDDQCRHGGPVKFWSTRTGWGTYDGPDETIAEHVEAQWRILTVHHLNGNKADCRWWNLVSLCQRCHLRVQRVVLMERVWPWEHSDWFKPYVAGYYAHAYLGEDIGRREAVERMDELLALERAA